MKRLTVVWMMIGLVGAAGLGSVLPAKADETCGDKGQKSCPLQGWMEDNIQAPLEKGDMKKVAEALEKAAAFAPDKKWDEGDAGWYQKVIAAMDRLSQRGFFSKTTLKTFRSHLDDFRTRTTDK